MIFGIFKFIFLYILFETISGIVVCAEVGAAIIIEWLRLLKTERIIPLSSYYSIFKEKLKEITTIKDKKHIIPMCIPFINMISIIPSLVETCKEIINSSDYIEESHIASNIERKRIDEIKRDNGLHFVNKVKELESFVIKPIGIEDILNPSNNGKYYVVGETYSYDECSYISYGTKMKITYGMINGKMCAIFDACDLEEIREIFPEFVPTNPNNLTDEKMTLIFLHKPNEADLSYLISSILYQRYFKKEAIDSEIAPIEVDGDDTIVKLTK